jgi:hypothetical protein
MSRHAGNVTPLLGFALFNEVQVGDLRPPLSPQNKNFQPKH